VLTVNLFVKRGLIIGVANLVVGLVLNWLVSTVLPSIAQEYQNGSMFRPWSDPLMMVYFGYPFILGFAASYLWDLVKEHLKGKPEQKAMQFATIYFIIATIPGMFITFTSFQISLGMVLVWAVTGFIQAYVAGLVITKVQK
jgi:hypothetical protein